MNVEAPHGALGNSPMNPAVSSAGRMGSVNINPWTKRQGMFERQQAEQARNGKHRQDSKMSVARCGVWIIEWPQQRESLAGFTAAWNHNG